VSPRGPRGWIRSDERILDELCERIVRAGVDASELEVAVERGEVRLHGHLETEAERRLVMDLAEDVPGVRAIDADIVVGARADEDVGEPTTFH
jgi:osmotically-inducible protein OsmY